MWKLVKKFFRLADAQRSTVLKAVVLLTLFSLVRRWFPFPGHQKLLETPNCEPPRESLTEAEDLVKWAVRAAASRLPWKPNCLPRALTGQYLLAELGQRTELCLGARLLGEQIRLHAWLECRGLILLGERARKDCQEIGRWTLKTGAKLA